MFLSIQHPAGTNGTQVDPSGASVSFNAAATIVIARKENFGTAAKIAASLFPEEPAVSARSKVYPNPFKGETNIVVSLEKTSTVDIKCMMPMEIKLQISSKGT